MPADISLLKLRELWIHTGTACNLECPFCHEGSKPGDQRLRNPSFDALKPHLDAAVLAGIESFAFTGGEPLIHKDIVRILSYALSLKPCLVLTNGTAPLIRRPHHLAQLKTQRHPLHVRVSIDYPNALRHDAGRGPGNFRKALQGLRHLIEAGFEVSIARQADAGENPQVEAARFRQLLRKQCLPEDLTLVPLPPLGRPFTPAAAFTTPVAGNQPTACSRSRMLLQRDDALHYAPCPLVDDDKNFDLGPDLTTACHIAIAPTHSRCATCFTRGVDYFGGNLSA
jgi:uncharacterized Fe-S cluster-containing radical SAM superfamily protein